MSGITNSVKAKVSSIVKANIVAAVVMNSLTDRAIYDVTDEVGY